MLRQLSDENSKREPQCDPIAIAEHAFDERGEELEELRYELERVSIERRLVARAPINDDLKKIPGVGRALEKRLLDAGVRHYLQLASLDAEEREVLADAVGINPGQIAEQGWVKAAKQLHRASYA